MTLARARTTPTFSMISGLFVSNLSYALNAIIWSGRTDNITPLWCGIGPSLFAALQLSLSDGLCRLSGGAPQSATNVLRWHYPLAASFWPYNYGTRALLNTRPCAIMLDLILFWGHPAIIVILHYIIQDHHLQDNAIWVPGVFIVFIGVSFEGSAFSYTSWAEVHSDFAGAPELPTAVLFGCIEDGVAQSVVWLVGTRHHLSLYLPLFLHIQMRSRSLRGLLFIATVLLGVFSVAAVGTSPAKRLMPLKPRYNRFSAAILGTASALLVVVAVPLVANAVPRAAVAVWGNGATLQISAAYVPRTAAMIMDAATSGTTAAMGEAVVPAATIALSSMANRGAVRPEQFALGPQISVMQRDMFPAPTRISAVFPEKPAVFRDSNNNPGCESGSGGGGGSPTTQKNTSTTHQTTTAKGTTAPDSTASAGSKSTATTGGVTASSSVPAPPSGSQNVVIDVSTNAEITWTGDWLTVASSCTPGSKAKAVSGNSTTISDGIMFYSFTGTAIYVCVASLNAQYTVSIDGTDTQYGSLGSVPTPSNCTFGWQQTDLSIGVHTFTIDVDGAIDSASRDIEAPWALELQNFVITQASSSVSDSAEPSHATASAKAGSGVGTLSAASTTFIPGLSLFASTIFVATVSLCI
ncbi:hypothetical protein K438DRAFT_1976599 [Mycena galopus ATCC 62051]|nr:hypothetical protein K438DRAFT_1976599 [Mycena galopus ATCC 62051]